MRERHGQTGFKVHVCAWGFVGALARLTPEARLIFVDVVLIIQTMKIAEAEYMGHTAQFLQFALFGFVQAYRVNQGQFMAVADNHHITVHAHAGTNADAALHPENNPEKLLYLAVRINRGLALAWLSGRKGQF